MEGIQITYLFIGAFAGLILGLVLSRLFGQNKAQELVGAIRDRDLANEEKVALKAKYGSLETSFSEQKSEVFSLRNLNNQLQASIAVNAERERALTEKIKHQEQELLALNERLKAEFENLANKILKQTTSEFSLANQKQMGEIVEPLKERLASFEKRVNDVYDHESKGRNELLGQVKSLMELNKQIREEANNLTSALKGDTKVQGAWGEFILEKILESSGLENGLEYHTQVSTKSEDGVFRPDVIVDLPDHKFIIIDSKVSLKAFESYVNSSDLEQQKQFLSQHVASMRKHVSSLSSKAYQTKMDGQALDFVLMFVPIESGFSEALKADRELYNYAWENKIVIVSPTTLLATLRTIASVWKQEKQTRNVIQIAEESGKLYDKFVGFLNDFQKIKSSLEMGNKAYDAAFNKLTSGNGNLISKAEKIKMLGAKTAKNIDGTFLNATDDED